MLPVFSSYFHSKKHSTCKYEARFNNVASYFLHSKGTTINDSIYQSSMFSGKTSLIALLDEISFRSTMNEMWLMIYLSSYKKAVLQLKVSSLNSCKQKSDETRPGAIWFNQFVCDFCYSSSSKSCEQRICQRNIYEGDFEPLKSFTWRMTVFPLNFSYLAPVSLYKLLRNKLKLKVFRLQNTFVRKTAKCMGALKAPQTLLHV